MGLLDMILNAGSGGAVQQLGTQFGLGQDQTTSALAALVPALAAGLQRNVQSEGGLAGLASALSTGQHQRYVNDPSTLANPAAIEDGNKILGHVLGSKDVSREVASQAAAQTGVSADILKQMLPMAATLVMGALASRSASSAGATAGLAGGAGSDLMGLLGTAMGSSPQSSSIFGALGKLFGG
jgi:hypothetical protein